MKKIWQSIFQAPYPALPSAIWVYVALCAVLQPQGGVFTGHIIGYDDQVRMTQVLDWVNGAGWYDRTIMRADPPEGFTTIWTRMVDIPIALIVLAVQQFVPQKAAALVAAAVMPLIELAVLFSVAPWFVRPLVGKARARLIIPFLLFTSILKVQYFSASGFLVGQASHHPWYIILNLVMFGAAARLAMGSAHRSTVLILGASIAVMTEVGIECYPMIAGAAATLAILAWATNRPLLAARGATGILCGALGALILLPMHRPPAQFFAVSFAEPSILGVILVAAAGAFLLAEYKILHRCGGNKLLVAVILVTLAALIGVALVAAFPAILDGAAAGLSPAERAMALSEHFEARPVHRLARTYIDLLSWLVPPLLALAAGIFATIKSRGRRRSVAFCYLAFAVVGCGMSEKFSRYYHHAMTATCAWLVWVWKKIKNRYRNSKYRSLIAFGSFIMLGPFWMLLLPGLVYDSNPLSQILLFPSGIQTTHDPCDSLSIADYIDITYPPGTLLLVPSWNSAQFLYQTDVRIDFVANYPSHDKFLNNYEFFRTDNLEEARGIALRHGIDLIAVCPTPRAFRANVPADRQSMIARLQSGQIPPWLHTINLPDVKTNYILYRVDKDALQQQEQP